MFSKITVVRAPKAALVIPVFSDDPTLPKAHRSAARDAALASPAFRAEAGETGGITTVATSTPTTPAATPTH